MDDILKRINEIEVRIAELPVGTVTYKQINGKEQPYLQWTEKGRSKSKYIKVAERDSILDGVKERRRLQDELIILRAELYKPQTYSNELYKSGRLAEESREYNARFKTQVITGSRLRNFAAGVNGLEKRECFSGLMDYLTGHHQDRIAILYGLRRTGKTILLRQTIKELICGDKATYDEMAYIKLRRTDSLADLNLDLDLLSNTGIRYVFLDEVTLLPDFIDGAAVLSDIYAASGIKIVLSGTDSLGFWLSKNDELYDRTVTLHTTWIPFREHSRLLGVSDIDEYIRHGGTLRAGRPDFSVSADHAEEASFRDEESTREYIDTAICRNIQHSLEFARGGRNFLYLQELYETGELTGAINRIIEDTNHGFLISVLTRPFFSHDFGSAADILRKDRDTKKRSLVLDQVDRNKVTEILRRILEVRNKDEQKIGINESHAEQIKTYLKVLDLICEIPVEVLLGSDKKGTGISDDTKKIVITQPGMRYVQAQALAYAVMQDDVFRERSRAEQEYVVARILEEVRGRMLEEIVLLETMRSLGVRAYGFERVYSVDFGDGSDLDMLIYDPDTDSCDIYEIKHSEIVVPEQARMLTDDEKCNRTESKFGKIKNKYILYRGENIPCNKRGVEYVNVEEYLRRLT